MVSEDDHICNNKHYGEDVNIKYGRIGARHSSASVGAGTISASAGTAVPAGSAYVGIGSTVISVRSCGVSSN